MTLSPTGEFVLPASIRLVTIFADINRNGVLDRFAEPSSPCVRDDGQWSCELGSTRLLVHRLIRTSVEDERHDRTIAVAEAYGGHGQPLLDAKLCDDRGTCAIPTTGPYAAAEPGQFVQVQDGVALPASVAACIERSLAREAYWVTSASAQFSPFRGEAPVLLSWKFEFPTSNE